MFAKVLVANRGEIAIRVIRALEELGDRERRRLLRARSRRAARRARRRGLPARPGARRPRATSTSRRSSRSPSESGAEAIHPGYGFLAENAAFAHACEEAGIVFIGPPAERDRRDGLQDQGARADAGRRRADRAGHDRAGRDRRGRAQIIDDEIGFPVAVKAAGGGGGKGFRVALTEDELEDAFEGAAREGEKFFSDATVYLERYLPDPRHVEVQVLADRHGNVIHLGERDCSVQRRHQKLIEESPAPAVDEELRERIGKIGADAAARRRLRRRRARSRACSRTASTSSWR